MVKSGTTLQGDLKLVNNLQNSVKQKIDKAFVKGEQNKNKKEEDKEFNINVIESNLKDIDKINKVISYIKI